MKIRRLLRDGVLAAVAFAALQTFQAYLVNEALLRQERFSTRKLQTAVAGVLNRAHQSKDDLTISQVMNALAKSPGIVEARIDETKSGAGYVLRDGTQKWGRLVLSVSDRSRRALVRRQWFAGTAAAGLLWIALFIYLQRLEKRTSDFQTQASELDGLLQSERRKRIQSLEREEWAALQSSACLQKAIQRIPAPLIILDAQQRLSAVNDAALSRLSVAEPKNVLGKSWQEIPDLACSGSGLEQSLKSPGQPVEWIAHDGAFRATFETDSEKLAGTWIFL